MRLILAKRATTAPGDFVQSRYQGLENLSPWLLLSPRDYPKIVIT